MLGAKYKQNWNPNKTNLIEWISQIKTEKLYLINFEMIVSCVDVWSNEATVLATPSMLNDIPYDSFYFYLHHFRHNLPVEKLEK